MEMSNVKLEKVHKNWNKKQGCKELKWNIQVCEMQKRNMWDMHANENKLMQTNCDENCKWVCKVWKQIVLCFEQYANENKLMQTNCDDNCKWVCKMWKWNCVVFWTSMHRMGIGMSKIWTVNENNVTFVYKRNLATWTANREMWQ